MGPEDMTAPFAVADIPIKQPVAAPPVVPENQYEPVPVHPLEMEPPADLPPLESVTDIVSTPQTYQDKPTASEPLSLKSSPGESAGEKEDSGSYVDDMKRNRSSFRVSPKALSMVVILILLATGGWFVADYMGKRAALNALMTIPILKATLTVDNPLGGAIFLNGKELPIAEGATEMNRIFKIKPGLHNLEVRHPDFGSRKYILELEPGEKKQIVVEFDGP